MEENKTIPWNIFDNRYRLPYSQRVNIPALLQVFSSTATSYKYLFFRALLTILEDSQFNQLSIKLYDILLEMLAIAWFPHTFFKLSFGANDRVAQELDRLGVEFPVGTSIGLESKNRLKALIALKDYTHNDLLRFVPYRLIRPFFTQQLRGLADTSSNKIIKKLAVEQFEHVRPFYYISEDSRSIVMHPEWMLYFYDNYTLVQSFTAWNWLDYMQRRNPSVPNLQFKLFPPTVRNSIDSQKRYWRTVLAHQPFSCIFSGEPLVEKNLSLDHFLPWSFVAHDQLWNLVPVSRSINSAKSNNLPSMDRYFNRFAELQFQALKIYRQNSENTAWNKVVEPYVADLHVKPDDLLNRSRLFDGLKATIEPLYTLAAAQGFLAGWEWNPRG